MRTAKVELFDDFSVNTHTFAEVGDELAIHVHGTGDNHLSFLDRGTLVVLGEREGLVFEPGDAIKWRVGERHGFRCIKAPATLRNIRHRFEPGYFEQRARELLRTRSGHSGPGQLVWYCANDERLPAQVVERYEADPDAFADLDVLRDGKLNRVRQVRLLRSGQTYSEVYCVDVGVADPIDVRLIEAARVND